MTKPEHLLRVGLRTGDRRFLLDSMPRADWRDWAAQVVGAPAHI